MKKTVLAVLDIVLIVIGSAIAAFAMDLFLIPYQIAPGGASGLSLVVHYIINEIVSTGMLIILINIPLFVISFWRFGKIFALKSILGTVIFSVLVDLLRPIANNAVANLFVRSDGTMHTDLLLFSLYGGVLLGIGFGLVLRAGASTGGSSLGAQLLNRLLPSVTTGIWLLILDAIVVVLAAVVFGNIVFSLYSIIVIYISSMLMDVMVEGINHAKAVYIISDQAAQIKEQLLYQLKRGVTTLVGKGAYSGSEKNVLLCVVQHAQVHELKRIVASIDENAFVVLTDAKEVLGEGFKR